MNIYSRIKKILINLIFNRTPAGRSLPYNLNWHQNSKIYQTLLGNQKLNCVDIGARGGSPKELKPLESFINLIAIDADRSSCESLRQNLNKGKFNDSIVLNEFISNKNSARYFNYFKTPSLNSALSPLESNFTRSDILKLDRKKILTKTLDKVLLKIKKANVDFLKIDTQGTELEVLKGSRKVLKNCLMIETEVSFQPMYLNQQLFRDIDLFLDKENFEMLYLNRVFAKHNVNETELQRQFRGELKFGDVLYGRKLESLKTFPNEKLLAYSVLLINYGHIDRSFAVYKILKSRDFEWLGGDEYFRLRKSLILSKLVKKFLLEIKSVFNWFIIFLLFINRTNHADTDSDRSWNIR